MTSEPRMIPPSDRRKHRLILDRALRIISERSTKGGTRDLLLEDVASKDKLRQSRALTALHFLVSNRACMFIICKCESHRSLTIMNSIPNFCLHQTPRCPNIHSHYQLPLQFPGRTYRTNVLDGFTYSSQNQTRRREKSTFYFEHPLTRKYSCCNRIRHCQSLALQISISLCAR